MSDDILLQPRCPHFRYLLETSLGSVADGPDYLGSGLRSHLPQDCDCE
jgi:hypothetical protein